MRFWSFLLAIFWVMTVPLTAEAQDKPKKPRKKKPAVQKTKWDEMDIGSFQAYGLEGQLAGKLWRPALKGLNIDLSLIHI